MIKIVTADGNAENNLLRDLRLRGEEIDAHVTKTVSEIIADVREKGDDALRHYTGKFDHVHLEKLELTKEQIDEAADRIDSKVRDALIRAAENIRDFHERQKQQSWMTTKGADILLGQQIRGLTRVGIYVPGGIAAYPSSVLMNAIPAKVAGVEEIIMTTPPPKDGILNPDIFFAAKLSGVDRIFLVGGAQGIAALAYGTQSVPTVDKIVGPGNIYIATAKKLVYGRVDIDMIAGPSEILIIADNTADPVYLAADLLSQAEHDEIASSILLTTSEEVAKRTREEIERQIPGLIRSEIMRKSIDEQGAIVICPDIGRAVDIANEIAPEHLELMVESPMELLGLVKNAGSVFLGKYSPEPLGDYYAGPNHILPTGGTARFFSPLSVDSFIKKMSFIRYSKEALKKAKDDIVTIGEAEGLTAHANAVKIRFS